MLGAQWDSIATSFIETLKFIYEGLPNNDHTLKGVAIDFASQNAKRLAESTECASLRRERGDIAFDILRAFATNLDLQMELLAL